mmetsp:Transcript_42837/g.100781  ORF Transcript_42837/g.100781 Transcript_42837/m.100781 type:complete len:206 (-) Transcript_42837:1166-1783(-)
MSWRNFGRSLKLRLKWPRKWTLLSVCCGCRLGSLSCQLHGSVAARQDLLLSAHPSPVAPSLHPNCRDVIRLGVGVCRRNGPKIGYQKLLTRFVRRPQRTPHAEANVPRYDSSWIALALALTRGDSHRSTSRLHQRIAKGPCRLGCMKAFHESSWVRGATLRKSKNFTSDLYHRCPLKLRASVRRTSPPTWQTAPRWISTCSLSPC